MGLQSAHTRFHCLFITLLLSILVTTPVKSHAQVTSAPIPNVAPGDASGLLDWACARVRFPSFNIKTKIDSIGVIFDDITKLLGWLKQLVLPTTPDITACLPNININLPGLPDLSGCLNVNFQIPDFQGCMPNLGNLFGGVESCLANWNPGGFLPQIDITALQNCLNLQLPQLPPLPNIALPDLVGLIDVDIQGLLVEFGDLRAGFSLELADLIDRFKWECQFQNRNGRANLRRQRRLLRRRRAAAAA